MRGVGQRCSFYHNTHQRPRPAASSASSTSSFNGSGSPPSSVHMGQLDSGYTTPSNLTSASVNTQETSAISSSDSSTASSTPTHGSTPAASPNTTAQMMSANYMSETLKCAQSVQNSAGVPQQQPPPPQSYTTMPRHFMNQRVQPVQQVQNQQVQPAVQVQHPSAQMAYMGTTGGTLQKVKRVYL